MKLVILPSARDDLAAGFSFYECQQEGLGDYFLDSLFSDIDSLLLYAGIHTRHFGFRRLLSRRFPYAVYYERSSTLIRIWAVLDCRRDPKTIRRTLIQRRESGRL